MATPVFTNFFSRRELRGAITVTDASGTTRAYESVDQMPPEIRAIYERARQDMKPWAATSCAATACRCSAIGGLLVSTFFTRVLIPTLYVMFEERFPRRVDELGDAGAVAAPDAVV